jgi:hypothetical protein
LGTGKKKPLGIIVASDASEQFKGKPLVIYSPVM